MKEMMKSESVRTLGHWTRAVVDLLFPRTCTVCGTRLIDGEEIMCLKCRMDFPLTNLHREQPNEIHYRLASLKAPLERATSLYHYQRGSAYVKLVHDTKYHDRPIVGRTLAREHAETLLKSGFFEGIDLLLPVPLHPIRQWRRGYNQSREIALGLSRVTGIPVGDNLKATRFHGTQTRLSSSQRLDNSRDRFTVIHPDELTGLHALIVDDVITTGSTITAALETIHAASPSTLLSVYSLGLTKLG